MDLTRRSRSVKKGSNVFKNVTELSEIGEREIHQMKMLIAQKDFEIAEK